jgi:hypothetical protein
VNDFHCSLSNLRMEHFQKIKHVMMMQRITRNSPDIVF